MRRKPSPEIAARACEIEHAHACAFCTAPQRDKSQGLALLVLGVELLEDLGFDRDAIRKACDEVLGASAGDSDPRADTTGT